MKTVYDYDLHVSGLFGRNRKAKREMFTVSRLGEKLTLEDAIKLAEAKLKEIKLSGVFSLYEREGTIDEDGIYSTMIKFGAKPIWNGGQTKDGTRTA